MAHRLDEWELISAEGLAADTGSEAKEADVQVCAQSRLAQHMPVLQYVLSASGRAPMQPMHMTHLPLTCCPCVWPAFYTVLCSAAWSAGLG